MTDQQSGSDRDVVPVNDEITVVDDAEQPLRIPLVEETLEARVVERESGKLVIRKRVETEPVTTRVELHHDKMEINEIVVDETATERREPWYEGDTLMVPVYEEVLVSYTELMLRKVIRIRNQGAIEQVDVDGTVRREVVEITEVDA
jgi:stress response protein YsnF